MTLPTIAFWMFGFYFMMARFAGRSYRAYLSLTCADRTNVS